MAQQAPLSPSPAATAATAAADTSTATATAPTTVTFHITGFGAFHGVPKNPTTELVGALEACVSDASKPLEHGSLRGGGSTSTSTSNVRVRIASATVLETSAEATKSAMATMRAADEKRREGDGAGECANTTHWLCYRVLTPL